MSEASEQGVDERGGAAPGPRAPAFAGLALLLLAELVRESWPVPAQTDDAYISYRYARNLVEGLGLVYNPGEYVEGMTNLLWTLLAAGGLWLGFGAKEVAVWAAEPSSPGVVDGNHISVVERGPCSP